MYSTIKYQLVDNRYFYVITKITTFLILFIGSLQLNPIFSLAGSVGEKAQIFYLFGGLTLGLAFIYGKEYALLIFPGFIINSGLTSNTINTGNLLIYAIFSSIYLLEALILEKVKFDKSLKTPKDILYLLTVTLILPLILFTYIIVINLISSGSLLIEFDTISAILALWLADLIGIITIFPFLMTVSYFMVKFIEENNKPTVKRKISVQLKSYISKSRFMILILFIIPLINQITVWVQQFTAVELFYLAYLPSIWLASSRDIKYTSIGLAVTNISFFFQRKSASIRTIEFQMLLLIFTLVCLLYSSIIGVRNKALEESNTKLQNTNQQLEEINKNLEISNQELEQFAYVASHDLQEPLRAITGYLQLFDRKYGDYPDAKAEKYVNGVISAAERMEKMINDLLLFSRVGTRNKEFSIVDLNVVVNQVKENLSKQIEETSATFNFQQLPQIYGNEIQMIQLFQNIVSNSLKYCDTSPRISISLEELNKRYVISVQDNGIGISSEYFDKIFVIFQRLHSKHEYGGSGIGLAISKKIVERHNGNIWVDAEEGKGSTFHISFPKPKEDSQ